MFSWSNNYFLRIITRYLRRYSHVQTNDYCSRNTNKPCVSDRIIIWPHVMLLVLSWSSWHAWVHDDPQSEKQGENKELINLFKESKGFVWKTDGFWLCSFLTKKMKNWLLHLQGRRQHSQFSLADLLRLFASVLLTVLTSFISPVCICFLTLRRKTVDTTCFPHQLHLLWLGYHLSGVYWKFTW